MTRTASSLVVARHAARFLISPHEASAAFSKRLARIAEAQPARLAACLSELPVPDERSMWLIRRCEVSVTADLRACTDAAVENHLAREIARAIHLLIAKGPDGANAVRYSSRAAWMSDYLRRRLLGLEHRDWRFQALEGWFALSPGQTAIGLAEQEPESAADLLACLGADGLGAPLVRALTEDQARRLVQLSIGAAPGARVRPAVAKAVAARWLRLDQDGLGPACRTLRLALESTSENTSTGALNEAYACARGLTALDDLLDSGLNSHTVRALIAGSAPPTSVPKRLRANLQILAKLDLSEEVWSELTGKIPRPLAPPDFFQTQFAGVFLLLGAFSELRLHEAIEQACHDEATRAEMRRRILAHCFGSDLRQAYRDSACTLAAGVADAAEPLPLPAGLARNLWTCLRRTLAARGRLDSWRRRGSPAERDYFSFPGPWEGSGRLDAILRRCGRALLRQFAASLYGFQASSPAYLRRNFLSGSGRVERIERGWRVLKAEPPLGIALRMAGMAPGVVRPPWLPQSLIELEEPTR